jgi:hypothetical protein
MSPSDSPSGFTNVPAPLMSTLTLRMLILRVVIALPIAFVVWHYTVHVFSWPLWVVVDWLRSLFLEGTVRAIESNAGTLVFPVRGDRGAFDNRAAELLLEVNTRLYTYGAPLFAALAIAGRAKWRHVLLGLLILVPFQSWGVYFELLKDLAFPSVVGLPKSAARQGFASEVIALGYQLGVLIFPIVVPVILAAIFTRQRLENIWRHAIARGGSTSEKTTGA